jgi:hypothetical protein
VPDLYHIVMGWLIVNELAILAGIEWRGLRP